MKRNEKLVILLASLAVLFTVGVAGTLAYLTAQTDAVTNTFTPSSVDTVVEETFDGTIKSNVSIKNDGNISAYIRASIAINWVKDGNNDGIYETVYSQIPVQGDGKDYVITYKQHQGGNQGMWLDGNDGYYYWSKPVPETGSTGVLIEKCELLMTANPPEMGYVLSVEILSQAIQANPEQAVIDAWGVSVDSNGNLSTGNN